MTLWCDEQIVVSIDGPGGPREVVVPAPIARIGSHSSSEVVLAGEGVAKRSLYLHATAEGLFSLDLDLEEGNLSERERGRWLAPTDTLQVGPYQISARTSHSLSAPPDALSLVARHSTLPPLPVLNIFCGRLLKDKRRFRSRLSLLGRRPQCSLQLRGAQVSSFHCALYWEQQRLWCIDLLSSNTTQLNGEPVACAEMHLHDRLGVGEFELEYNRWSPRRSMQPGWEPAAGGDALDDDVPASALGADGSAISGELPDSGSSVISGSLTDTGLHLQLAEEVARLAGERLDLQRQWAETSQRLTERIDELHAESLQLSRERASLESARAEWQAERELLLRELASRSSHLARLETEVSATTSSLAQRLNQVERAAAASVSSAGTVECPAPAALALVVNDDSRLPADVDSSFSASAEDAAAAGALPGEGSPHVDESALIQAAVGRRGKAARTQMKTFVSDRLREMETTKRQKSLVVWAAIGAATLTLSAALLGVWMWLQ